MNNYDRILPNIFPYAISVTREQAAEAVGILILRDDIPALSSFALQTGVDRHELQPQLWLSEASASYLVNRPIGSLLKSKIKAAKNEVIRKEIYE